MRLSIYQPGQPADSLCASQSKPLPRLPVISYTNRSHYICNYAFLPLNPGRALLPDPRSVVLLIIVDPLHLPIVATYFWSRNTNFSRLVGVYSHHISILPQIGGGSHLRRLFLGFSLSSKNSWSFFMSLYDWQVAVTERFEKRSFPFSIIWKWVAHKGSRFCESTFRNADTPPKYWPFVLTTSPPIIFR